VPSVSIVLPTRDRPERLLTALQAVARQDHQELQLILVRDGGAPLTDEARVAIRALGFPTTFVEHDGPAEGAARARNRGVEAARGDAIALLDDDDDWTADHVRRLATSLDRDDKADVVYSDVRVVREDDGSERIIARDFDLARFTRDGYVPPSSLLARRAAFAGFGQFDPEFAYSEDWEWLVRVAKKGGVIARVSGVTATIRIHSGGMSALVPERLAERQRCLDLLSQRHKLGPIEPKTFWEVAADVCRAPNATTS
jgi:GT2 family glycosyltransferase